MTAKKYIRCILGLLFFCVLVVLNNSFSEYLSKNESLGQSIAIVLLIICAMALPFLIRDTLKGKGYFRIKFKRSVCPECLKKPTISFRIPQSLKQLLGIEWVCEYCGNVNKVKYD